MLPKDFYNKAEEPGYLKNILYGDTDSLFILVPNKDSEKLTTEEKLKFGDKAADDINVAIIKYLNEYLLPKSNIPIANNNTFFKSEMLMEAIMLLDVKKNYAYTILAKKGKIFKEPKIKYTGIQVVKSDAAKLTQDMLKDMIENVVLNPQMNNKDRLSKLTDIVNNFYNKFIEYCDNLDLNYISFPGKWSKKDMIINGMKLYNHIVNEEIFSMSSSATFIYCSFKNPKLFGQLDMSKTNGLCVPYSYDKELVKQKMEEFKIEIDRTTQWSKLFTTTASRVVDLVKGLKNE